MKSLGFLLWSGLMVFALVGCDSEAAKNRNASIVANYNKAINGNRQNTNANVNVEAKPNVALDDEEVTKFSDATVALKKGDEYLDAGSTKNAIEAFRQSTELDPDLAEAHFKLGVAYALSESEEELKAANVSVSENKAEKTGKPKKKNSEKSFENAVKAYKNFIRKNPKSHEGYYNLGRAYNKLYDDQEAQKALQKAVNLNGEDSLYRTELGAVLIKLAKYSSAIRELNKAIELDEDNFRAEDLLVKAKAGQKRTGFKPKDQKN